MGLFGLFVAIAVVTRAPFLGAPLLSDEPVHMLGSWTLLRGGHLYIDFVDNKPPLVYAYYALAQWLLPGGIVAVRLLTTFLWVPLTALALAAFFRFERSGLLAGVLYLIASASFLVEESLAVNTEVLMLLPAAWAFTVLRSIPERRRGAAFAAGVLLGTAALFKVTAMLWLPAAPLIAWTTAPGGRRWSASLRASVAVSAGFCVSLGAAMLVLTASRGAAAALDWTFVRNLAYVSEAVSWSEALVRAATGAGGWLLCTLPLWWAAGSAGHSTNDATEQWLARILVVLAIPSVLLGLRFFAHYYLQMLCPLCLAAAPAASVWARRPLSPAVRVAAFVLVLILVSFTAVNAWLVFGPGLEINSKRPVFAQVASWLRKDACSARGTMFVWGIEPIFYVDAGLQPATRFVLPQETISGYIPGRWGNQSGPRLDAIRERDWNLLMDDLERNRATYILDTTTSGLHRWGQYRLAAFPRLLTYVREHYQPATIVARVVIYRRRGCGTAVAP